MSSSSIDNRLKFDEPFTLIAFLEVLIQTYRQELLGLKTPIELVNKIYSNRLIFDRFQKFLLQNNFALRWDALCRRCIEKPCNNMWETANNLLTHLSQTGSAIKHFKNYPEPPKSASDFEIIDKRQANGQSSNGVVAGPTYYKEKEYADLQRYCTELCLLYSQEKRRYTRVQRLYLNNRICAMRNKRSLHEMHEKRPQTTTGLVTTNSFALNQSMKAANKKNSLQAIDFFKALNPNDANPYESFSYLDADKRVIYDKLEQHQEKLLELFKT